jgi:hypothetical protein
LYSSKINAFRGGFFMRRTRSALLFPVFLLLIVSPGILAGEKKLPYPATKPDAGEVARQVYFVNHFLAVRNVRFGDRGQPVVLVDREGKGVPRVTTMVRRLNNDYRGGAIASRDLVIFTSGKLKGTGILVTDYADPKRPLGFSVWLPALRKIRRHAEPDQGDSWGGSLFTYGDIYLRRPADETHQLLEPAPFPGCLQPIELPEAQRNRHLRRLPPPRCDLEGKPMLRLQSHARFGNWWYDYRIIWIDPVSFADYRSEYYSGGKKIKVIDKDWRSMNLEDPRAQYWQFWSGFYLVDGRQGMAFVPEGQVYWNEAVRPGLWNESTLRRIKR